MVKKNKSEDMQKQIKEITDRLEQGVKDVFTSENYARYLETMSKFHNYSLNNIILIAMQKPDATMIAGYNAWKKLHGRQVMKGEKGLKILAPSPYKVKRVVEKLDPQTKKPMVGEDGKIVTEEKEITIPAYKVVSVFDVSQTEGKEIPTLGVDELTGEIENYDTFFEALSKCCPIPISFEKIDSGAKGYFSRANNMIAINEGMSQLQTVKTTVHEIAHQKLHSDMEAAKQQTRNSREVEAESVAYVVCQHYGIDTSDYSFTYVAGWSEGKETPELKESLDTIRKAASELITDIDQVLEELQLEKVENQQEVKKTDHDPTVTIIDSIELDINDFLENLAKNNKDGMLNALYNAPIAVNPARFTKNGNAVESQEALLGNGENHVSVRFYNRWDPMQVGVPAKAIKQTIEIVLYKNGNATAIRTLAEKKSMSLKNAESNYHEMLKKWKRLTKQREITFDSVTEKNPNESVLDKLHENQGKIMQSNKQNELFERKQQKENTR